MDGVRDILVIDDDWGFCQLVLRMLQAADGSYEVRRADDGEAGLQALREQPPDLLLLDLVMPDMDGFHILDEVRTNPELGGFPVILLTATSYVEDALRQLSSQIILNRARGFSPGEVAQCLRGVLNALDPEYDEDLIASASEMIKSDLARPLPPV
jgi:CheY-like chemotaxis protein